VELDRVTLQRNAQGDVLMAHRAVHTDGRAELRLRLNQEGGSPDAFVELPGADYPESGPNFEIVSVPTGPDCQGPEEFVIAYEAVAADGTTDVRLLPRGDYGSWRGYAPLPTIDRSRKLEDLGLVCREGSVFLALLTTSQAGLFSIELNYTEVPFTALDPITGSGAYPGVNLDIASETTRARLACKPFPQATCPMIWSGDDEVRVLFVRR
jgi:hypothetical protein